MKLNPSEETMVAALKAGSTKAIEPVPADRKGDKIVSVLAIQVLTLIDIIERATASSPAPAPAPKTPA